MCISAEQVVPVCKIKQQQQQHQPQQLTRFFVFHCVALRASSLCTQKFDVCTWDLLLLFSAAAAAQSLIRKRSRRACLQLLAAIGAHAQPFRCLAVFHAEVEAQLLQTPLALVSALLCCIPKCARFAASATAAAAVGEPPALALAVQTAWLHCFLGRSFSMKRCSCC